jgi:cytidylate kinase
MTVIAMTREMGTLGKEVARRLQERLSLRLVHHELVATPVERREAPFGSEVVRMLDGTAAEAAPGTAYMTPEEIYALALEGDVIIRGWGAARLLKGIPHVISVRVCAPPERRVAEMMRRRGIDEAQAGREIRRSDAAHGSVFKRLFGADWRDPQNYDLVLNTGQVAPEICAELLIDASACPSRQETKQSRRALKDRRAEARVSALLKGWGAGAGNVYASVTDGVIQLYGAAHDRVSACDIESAVCAAMGGAEVRSEIRAVGARHHG